VIEALLAGLLGLAQTFGPVGAVSLALVAAMAGALVAGVRLYRRDFVREREALRAAHERRDRREERLADVVERNAAASERLAGGIEHLGRELRTGLEHQSDRLSEILREVRR
jgi:hypothetical protein